MHPLYLLVPLALILALPLPSQSLCHAVNDDDQYDTSIALGFPVAQAGFKGVAAGNLAVVAAEVFTGESSGTMRLAIWSHDPANNRPLALLGTAGSWTMTRVNCWQGAVLGQPVQLTQGQHFWLVWDTTMFCQASFSTAPANVDYCYSANGGASWQQQAPGVPYRQPAKYRLYCAGTSGSVALYGTGKAGTGALVPAAGVTGWPAPGNPIDVTLDLAARRVPALLLVGPRQALNVGVGTALVFPPIVVLPVVTGSIFTPAPIAGFAGVTLRIPPDASLRGVKVGFQWWVVDAGAMDGLSHSDGAEVTIQ
jgi:hypothetical protein